MSIVNPARWRRPHGKVMPRKAGTESDHQNDLPFSWSDVAQAVMAFHVAFDLPRKSLPTIDVDPFLAELRIRLLTEELAEFVAASRGNDLVALADALGDIVYVAYGAAITYGIDLDAVLAEIHRANMSKLDESGRPILRGDGKVLKSNRYRPPDVSGVIQGQDPLPNA
jgi:predicted HAD superfamily Cof-like phosphohydrolase